MCVQIAWEDLKSAMNVLRRFNLVLVLEFVEDEMWALEEAFGWSSPRKQVRGFVAKAFSRQGWSYALQGNLR